LAVNKRKILENAQKYLQKGQLDKALKEYQTLVELDPRDANLRLKLGDIQLRQGNKEAAVACYLKVAEQFMHAGFDAKAVALYKQVAKIDETRHEIHEPLAELYQRLGLTAEAFSALQTAADLHHREGRKREALELLRKMAALDPTNTTSRLKIADLLRQAGMPDEALAEYAGVAEELERQGAAEPLLGVHERILELAPEKSDSAVAIARILVGRRELARAEAFARRAVETGRADAPAHQLLAEILTSLRRMEEATDAWRALAEVHRNRGDEAAARDIAQRYLADPEISLVAADFGELSGVHGPELAAAAAPSPPPVAAVRAESAANAAATGDADGFSADAEQLLAEASVYLRYGKSDRAIATLEALLSSEPDHRVALEKLGEVHAERGDHAKAVEVWLRAARVAAGEEDAAAEAALRARIEALDPAAVERLGGTSSPDRGEPAAPVADEPEPRDETLDGVDLDIDLGDDGFDAGLAPGDDLETDAPGGEPDAPPARAGAAERTVFQLDADVERGSNDESASGQAAPTVFQLDGMTLPGQPRPGDAGETVFQVDVDEAAPAAAREPAGAGGSSTSPQQVAEDLEEADFYFGQGLIDEAEAIYRRILEVAPSHPQAMLRLGEIAEQRGEDPGASGGSLPAAAITGPPTQPFADEGDVLGAGDDLVDWDTSGEDAAGDTAEATAAPEPPAPSEEAPAEAAPEPACPDDLEIDLDLGDGAAGETAEDSTHPQLEGDRPPVAAEGITAPPVAEPELAPPAPEPAFAVADESVTLDDLSLEDEPEPEPEPEPPAAPAAAAPQASPDAAEPEETFDLAAELSDVFDGDEARGAEAADDGFEAIFREFKKGVRAQLSESDYEAHYDLGIAYREMGLFDDALGEFRISMASPERQLSSLHMLGLCALDLGRPGDAVAHLEQALALPGVPLEQQAGLRLDLGRAFEAQGDLSRARHAFEAVLAFDPDHQDVRERLAALDDPSDGPAEVDEAAVETFESFDDLIAEAESALQGERRDEPEADGADDAPELAAEAVTELEADGAPDLEPEPEADSAAEPEPEPAAEPEVEPAAETEPPPDPATPPRRKRRISFF
jgi:tetratricopeptide (TPR) repeat protein